MIRNTFVFNPVRSDYIHRALETLYKHTDMSQNRVIVVDQTLHGLKLSMDKVHMVLRPHRNLGFAKSHNEGMILAYRWGSEYITATNDDVEWINGKWWNGILDTFVMDEKILAVNPMSPREPGWGYGLEHGKYIDLIEYKKEFSEEDYEYLLKGDFSKVQGLPDSFPRQKNGVIDAIATWSTTFKRESIEKIGFFDERYYPGGGEDYDLDARIYRLGLRMVGTTKSWVWHFWGSSKDKQSDVASQGLPIKDDLRWMNPDFLWPPEKNNGQKMDPWGKWTDEKGEKHPLYRIPEIGVVDI